VRYLEGSVIALPAAGGVRIRASAVGIRQELLEVLALADTGKVQCQVTTRPLPEANFALEELDRVTGRIVLITIFTVENGRDCADVAVAS